MKLLSMILRYKLKYRYIFLLSLVVTILLVAMESKCPVCQRDETYWTAKVDDLYKAINRRDNQLAQVILHCNKHRKEQMEYTDYLSTDYTPLLKAAIDGNNEAIKMLITAGVNIAYTNKFGLNIFNYVNYKDRKKTMSVIIDSLQTFEQIQSFCFGEFGQRLYQKGINKYIFCKFLAMAGRKFYLSTWFSVLNRENLIGKDNQKKMQEFCELQKTKMDILVKHSPALSKLPSDMRNIIRSLVFPVST